jgi:hypothetical protein
VIRRIVLGILLLLGSGCTDAEMAERVSLGSRCRVTLYSGGKPVREWVSTGKVQTEEKSDGWYFMDAGTSKLVRVSGDVTVEQQ